MSETDASNLLRRRIDELAAVYEEREKRGAPYRTRSLEYEKLAVDYSNKGFQTLTYLNGGALVALPAAIAFLKTDIPKTHVLSIACAFIVGLIAVVFAQGSAFFVMAKRSEAEDHYKNEQFYRVAALLHEPGTPANLKSQEKANTEVQAGNTKIASSNSYRLAGLISFGLSLVAFLSGCGLGVWAAGALVLT